MGPVGRPGTCRRDPRLRGALPLRPLRLARRQAGRRLARRLEHDQRAGGDHEHAPAGHARLAGDLPPPVGPRSPGGHRRPRVRRPRRARPRRRLARGRAPRARVPVRHAARSLRPPRRAVRDRPPLVDRGTVRLQRSLLPPRTRRPAAQARPEAPPVADRRRQRQAPRGEARRPLGRRVQHGLRDRRRVPGAPGADRRRLRRGGPRPDPLQPDDRLRRRRRPRRTARRAIPHPAGSPARPARSSSSSRRSRPPASSA